MCKFEQAFTICKNVCVCVLYVFMHGLDVLLIANPDVPKSHHLGHKRDQKIVVCSASDFLHLTVLSCMSFAFSQFSFFGWFSSEVGCSGALHWEWWNS